MLTPLAEQKFVREGAQEKITFLVLNLDRIVSESSDGKEDELAGLPARYALALEKVFNGDSQSAIRTLASLIFEQKGNLKLKAVIERLEGTDLHKNQFILNAMNSALTHMLPKSRIAEDTNGSTIITWHLGEDLHLAISRIKFTQLEEVNYAMDWRGYLSFDHDVRSRHMGLTKGEPQAACGTTCIKSRIPALFDGESGHYRPSLDHLEQLNQIFTLLDGSQMYSDGTTRPCLYNQTELSFATVAEMTILYGELPSEVHKVIFLRPNNTGLIMPTPDRTNLLCSAPNSEDNCRFIGKIALAKGTHEDITVYLDELTSLNAIYHEISGKYVGEKDENKSFDSVVEWLTNGGLNTENGNIEPTSVNFKGKDVATLQWKNSD